MWQAVCTTTNIHHQRTVPQIRQRTTPLLQPMYPQRQRTYPLHQRRYPLWEWTYPISVSLSNFWFYYMNGQAITHQSGNLHSRNNNFPNGGIHFDHIYFDHFHIVWERMHIVNGCIHTVNGHMHMVNGCIHIINGRIHVFSLATSVPVDNSPMTVSTLSNDVSTVYTVI